MICVCLISIFFFFTDNMLLLQPFCTKAQFLSGKAKVDLIEKVAGTPDVAALNQLVMALTSDSLSMQFCCFSLSVSRPCDGALPSQAPDGGAESVALAVAPPGLLYPQRHHSRQGRQREGCYGQLVPSPLCPDGAKPE